jgi:penicillin-binding protein 1C
MSEARRKVLSWARRRSVKIGVGVGVVTVSLLGWLRCGPLPAGFLDQTPHRSVIIEDRDGRPLYESLSTRELRSLWLEASSLPPHLVDATLAAEDRRFFIHPGLDPVAIVRALWSDLRAGRLKEGGSTLTQQVVKQLMARRRTVAGKLREMVLALRLEHRLSKREILALYLNLAPYGNQYAGAQSASLGYFGCPVANLTQAQAAFLAGLPQRPDSLDPYRHLQAAYRRQRTVLARMRDGGFLGCDDYERCLAERLAIRAPNRPFLAPHFVQRVLDLGEGRAEGRVRTTLDSTLQAEIEGILASRRRDLISHGAQNVAVAVMDNATGEWLAWEGSGGIRGAGHGGAIDGVVSPRQPGSALKPFTYALAFENGFTPASVLPDLPSHFPTAQPGILYSPRNYDGIFRGPLLARRALAGSENIPAVWLLSRIGVPDLLEFLRTLGFSTLDRTADYYGYGLTLGDTEVRLDEMVAAYASIARGGEYLAPRALLVPAGSMRGSAAEGSSGRSPRRVMSRRAAFWIADILSDNEARAFAFGRGGSLEFSFQVAAKTGTSQAYRDNWTLGFTREVTVGVWVGNFDGTPLTHSSGVTGAGPIFHEVVLAAERRVLGRLPLPSDPPITMPTDDLTRATLCGISGLKASESCPVTIQEWVPRDEIPPVCRWHLGGTEGTQTNWPPEYRSWARGRGASVAAMEKSRVEGPAAREKRKALAIENPPDGSTYWIDPTLRTEYQALEFRVVLENPELMVSWRLDGGPLGRTRADGVFRWPLQRGAHRLEVEVADGRRASSSFLVK